MSWNCMEWNCIKLYLLKYLPYHYVLKSIPMAIGNVVNSMIIDQWSVHQELSTSVDNLCVFTTYVVRFKATIIWVKIVENHQGHYRMYYLCLHAAMQV